MYIREACYGHWDGLDGGGGLIGYLGSLASAPLICHFLSQVLPKVSARYEPPSVLNPRVS
jgi:hypothetical protein